MVHRCVTHPPREKCHPSAPVVPRAGLTWQSTRRSYRLAFASLLSAGHFYVNQQMKAALFFALLWLAGPSSMAGQLEVIGRFNDVSSADGGEHCSGYSLDLWDENGRLLGLLHHHSGLCGDPPCAVIESASLDRTTGRLRFKAAIKSEKLAFSGTLRREHVSGKLNGRSLRMMREPLDASASEWDKNLPAWCSFWESVPRCTGVKELCNSLR